MLPYGIDDLVEVDLVERRPGDGDRRAHKVVATEYGRAVFDEVESAVAAAERSVLDALDDT